MKKSITLFVIIIAVVVAIGATSGWEQAATVTMPFTKPNIVSDIPYATLSDYQKLDIYYPSRGKGPFPVIISIHGGGYYGGDKVGPDLLSAMSGLRRGYAIVSVNYRLSDEAVFPAQIHDVKAAIRFVKANAALYNLNTDKIALWGSSAGGHLSSLAATTANLPELQDLTLGNPDQSEQVQVVVDWCGPMNLLTMDAQFQQSGINGELQDNATSFGSRYLGKQVTLVPDLVHKSNPETYISPDDPPFYIQHGTADTLVPVQQSIDFEAKLVPVLGRDKVKLVLMPGEGHNSTGFTNATSLHNVLNFIDANLKDK